MSDKQKELFERIANTQYAWLRLRGIVQNEFNEDNPVPSVEEIKEWLENLNTAIQDLYAIGIDTIDFFQELENQKEV